MSPANESRRVTDLAVELILSKYFAFEEPLSGADGVGAEHLGDSLALLVEEAADSGADIGGLSILEAIHFGLALQCLG